MDNNRLKQLLASRNLKLCDLAGLVKVNKATVTRWNQSRVPLDRVADISRETGIPAIEIRPDLAALVSPTEVAS